MLATPEESPSAAAPPGFEPYKEGGVPLTADYEGFSSAFHVRAEDGHGAFYPTPTPELLDRYYNGAFSEGGNDTYNLEAQFTADVVGVARGVMAMVQDCAKFPERFAFHDFGCAFGALVWGFQQLGCTATGNEPNQAWVDAGNRLCGGALSALPLEQHLASLGYKVDLMTALHVVEHLRDPVAALSTIREHLAPEGLVHICVPNAASIQYALGGRRADVAYVYPMHLNYFTPKSVCAHLRAAGLEPFILECRWLSDDRMGPDYVYDALGGRPPEWARKSFQDWLNGSLFGQEIFVLAGLPGNAACVRDPLIDLKAEWVHRLANPAVLGDRFPALPAPALPPRVRLRTRVGAALRRRGLLPSQLLGRSRG